MDLLKALKRTTILSAIALLALGATEAGAVSTTTTTTGHVSASVQGTLAVAEVNAVRFGNMSIACAGGGGACTGGAKIVMTDTGGRTATNTGNDIITLLTATSADSTGGSDLGGVTDAGGLGTGGQGPGIYSISTSDTAQDSANVYVTFANAAGNILSATYDPGANVVVTGPGGSAQTFTFDNLTFQQTTASGSNFNIYSPTAVANDEYGQSVTLTAGGTAQFQVGGTLHTTATNQTTGYAPGKYVGTFYVMVSY